MSIAKVIEVKGEGDTLEAAVQSAVDGATKSVRNVRSAYVQDFEAIIEDGSIARYRVTTKITFVVGKGGDMS